MPRVIHFEIPADNAERAIKFYSDVFGWNIQKWGPQDYWLVDTGEKDQPGIGGAITKTNGPHDHYREYNRRAFTRRIPKQNHKERRQSPHDEEHDSRRRLFRVLSGH
jgi:catechol 2,3-dioxygenase-like lactoylglutathione lyase family enzyme